jgi:Regulator of ribonuclease activity B
MSAGKSETYRAPDIASPTGEASTMPDTCKELLARQLAMNKQTWSALKSHGVTGQSELRLDFSFNAPNREAAESLVAFLHEETDYELRVTSSGSFLRRRWRVDGTTQATTVSLEILDEWVTWMVIAGKEKECEFDGWGTSI